MKNILPAIATLGGHSALEIFLGAKKHNFPTLVIAQKGRDKTYTRHFANLVDDKILVDKFDQLTDPELITRLRERDCIFIPHRYCQVYCDLEKIENNFPIPIFGNKKLLKYEEREGIYNQYQLLNKAKINYPQQFKNPKDINRLVIVKVKEAVRNYERAFFFARNFQEYQKNGLEMVNNKMIKEHDLENAVIEQYLIGTQVNFNFFYSPLRQKLELLGTDTRRQTNIDGLVRIPADKQLEVLKILQPSYIETGHIAVTVKESLLEKAFEIGEKLVAGSKKVVPPGIIGPFALQTVISAGPPKEEIIVFDLSLRIPGSPGTGFTPYSKYLFGESITFGDRIAMEIDRALKSKSLIKITT